MKKTLFARDRYDYYLTTVNPKAARMHYNAHCPMHLEPPMVKIIYTVEVRWPGQLSVGTPSFTLGIDDEAFAFTRTILQQVYEFTKRAAAAVSPHADVKLTDTWKPITVLGGINMQRIFTIECRVDFRDEDKLPLFKQICQQAAHTVYAQAGFLGDGVKPEIIVHSHDFYIGHQDIALFDENVINGVKAISEVPVQPTTNSAAGTPANGEPVQEGYSEELMRALK